MNFDCNICGTRNAFDPVLAHRELIPCEGCGSNARLRGIFRAVQDHVIKGRDWKRDAAALRQIRGFGFSDAPQYAETLKRLFNYRNTFYHKKPLVDLLDFSTFSDRDCDFIVCTDVMEHVTGELDTAFGNLRKALKPGGVLIFSVPYLEGDETIEHFPHLHEWKLAQVGEHWFLNNVRKDGTPESFTALHFHGGPGAVLEMRMFGEGDLLRRLTRAGFSSVVTLDPDLADIGYVWPYVVHRDDHAGRRMKGAVMVCA